MIRHEGDKWVLYSHDGEKTLGTYDTEDEAKERERQIMAAQHAKEAAEYDRIESSFAFVRMADLLGREWDVRVLKFGTSMNGWEWTREAGERMLPFLKHAPVGFYAYKNGTAHAKEEDVLAANGAVTRNIVGDLQDPRIEADGIYARLHLHEDAAWLRTKLVGLAQRGVVDKVLGLSVDTLASYVKEGGRRVIDGVKRLFSVDIVSAPSADGRFLRATAGLDLPDSQEDVMKKTLVALIKEHRPALLEGKNLETLTEDELTALVKEAMSPQAPKPDPKPTISPDDLDAKLKRMETLERAAAVREAQIRVSETLAKSTLPEPVKARVRKDFADQMPTQEQIDARVKEEVELLGALSKSGEVRGFGEAGRVLVDSKDKLQAAMDKLFGVTPEGFGRALEAAPFMSAGTVARIKESLQPDAEAAKGIVAFRGLRDAYAQITGDWDVSGRVPTRMQRVSEAQFSADWPNILGNTLYRRMLMDYAEAQYNERTISSYGSAVDFRTKEVTILDYFPDIATVDPENEDYQEIAKLNDAKVSYAVIQKGNILTITRKTIINDDLNQVSKLVGRMGRSFRRTLARFIWNFWISNAAYDVDATAWFHTNHGNTGSTALSADATGAAEVLAKIIQLADMTEQGSGEKLGLPPLDSLYLDVPHALYAVALRLNNAPEFGAGVANTVYHRFGMNGERINVNPLFTDVTDWGVHVAPGAAGRESIQVDFLQGREEPEFFLADMPTVGQMFYGDKIQYKGRHEYGGDVMDFRGATKNVVAG
jgi:hypothetical protein